MRAARPFIIVLAALAAGALTLVLPAAAQEEQESASTRYARDSRDLESRIIVQDERYLRGAQRLLVTPELLQGFEPDYVEFYLDGELAAIDSEPPFEATFDLGPTTGRHSILIIATRETVIRRPAGAVAAREPEAEPEETFEIRIANPADDSYVLGRTPIMVEAELEAGVELEAVQVFVDGELVGTITGEPWQLVHDFGRGLDGHTIRVDAFDSTGRRATASVTTAPLERSDYYIEANVVVLEVTVTDDHGRLAGGLTRDDFEVFEDGAEREIRYFSAEERPLWVAVLVDTSGSMRGSKIRRSVFAAQQFIRQLKQADNALIVTFGPDVQELSEFTSDFEALISAAGAIEVEPRAMTPLNQAIYETLDRFEDRIGRRAMIVISDGADTASRVGPDEVHEAARQADVRVYSIGIREIGIGGGLGELDDPAAVLLRGLADVTGGDSYFPTSTGEFLDIFATIAEELRSQYSIGYVPPPLTNDRWREVEVRVKRGGLRARTREGYYPEER